MAKARATLAAKIADVKESEGVPIEDLKVEEKLRARISKYASRVGLDQTLASDLVAVLLDSSKRIQRNRVYGKRIMSFLRGSNIDQVSIVGAGRMGGWLARYFRSLGLRVVLFDRQVRLARKIAKEFDCAFVANREAIVASDLVFVAIPVSETAREIKQLIRAKKKSSSSPQAIIELSSVKEKVCNEIEYGKIPIVSIHPLFGASAHPYDRHSIAVVVHNSSRASNDDYGFNLVKHLFPQFNVVKLDAESHDRQMALMLSLPHTMSLAFGDVVARNFSSKRNESAPKTPSYMAQLEFAKRGILSESPEVYYEIQSANKFTPRVLQELLGSIERILNYIKDGEGEKKFAGFFERTRKKI
jgi:prephenate dehydrogenase/chorismate mutase